MELKAVIFDLNGTVVKDEFIYGAAFRKVLRKLGKKVDKKYPHIGGIGVKENWPRLLAKYKVSTNKTLDELEFMTQEAYLEEASSIKITKGFRRLSEELKNGNIKIALATSNSIFITDKILPELALTDFFDLVVTKEDVKFNKPSPDIFLTAAEKLGLKPHQCVVIEDSKSGIEAAGAAGMKVVGIFRDKGHAESLKDADLLIKDFNSLKMDQLQNL